jgi:hypothetical protein
LSHDSHRIAAIPAAVHQAVHQVYTNQVFLEKRQLHLMVLHLLPYKLSGKSDYFFLALYRIHVPKQPPSGQEGRGSYVWVPYHDQDKEIDDVFLEEQQAGVDFVDDVAEEDNNGSAHTHEEYEDVYTPDDVDIEQFEESGVVDEEDEGTGQIA